MGHFGFLVWASIVLSFLYDHQFFNGCGLNPHCAFLGGAMFYTQNVTANFSQH